MNYYSIMVNGLFVDFDLLAINNNEAHFVIKYMFPDLKNYHLMKRVEVIN